MKELAEKPTTEDCTEALIELIKIKQEISEISGELTKGLEV